MIKISGRVIHGQKKGRALGFPTANVIFDGSFEKGVYCGRVVINQESYLAAIFFGGKNIVEAYLLDFSGDLYGQEIEILVGAKIREVVKFKSEEDLKKQIAKDVEKIRCL